MKKRVITAVVLLLVGAFALHCLPVEALSYLTLLIAGAGAWEWARLLCPKQRTGPFLYSGFFIGLAMVVRLFSSPQLLWFFWIGSIVFFLFWAGILLYCRYGACLPDRQHRGVRLLQWCSGILLLLPAWLSLQTLFLDRTPFLVLLLALTMAVDMGGYFIGNVWGQHVLLPEVSPKKTWEGVLGGGIFVCVLLLLVCTLQKGFDFDLYCTIYVAVLVWLLAVEGDLIESLHKRLCNAKDSGVCLPGHGGLLDRIDSWLPVLSVVGLGYITHFGR